MRQTSRKGCPNFIPSSLEDLEDLWKLLGVPETRRTTGPSATATSLSINLGMMGLPPKEVTTVSDNLGHNLEPE